MGRWVSSHPPDHSLAASQDELDAIMGQRNSSGTEHEGSRRLKTELLIQVRHPSRTAGIVHADEREGSGAFRCKSVAHLQLLMSLLRSSFHCTLASQMDGLAQIDQGQARVFVLAASNLPWDLDVAMLRRLEKRVRLTGYAYLALLPLLHPPSPSSSSSSNSCRFLCLSLTRRHAN